MKSKMFKAAMYLMNAHSAGLQALGFSKWDIRDHSPIHKLIVLIAFKLSSN